MSNRGCVGHIGWALGHKYLSRSGYFEHGICLRCSMPRGGWPAPAPGEPARIVDECPCGSRFEARLSTETLVRQEHEQWVWRHLRHHRNVALPDLESAPVG